MISLLTFLTSTNKALKSTYTHKQTDLPLLHQHFINANINCTAVRNNIIRKSRGEKFTRPASYGLRFLHFAFIHTVVQIKIACCVCSIACIANHKAPSYDGAYDINNTRAHTHRPCAGAYNKYFIMAHRTRLSKSIRLKFDFVCMLYACARVQCMTVQFCFLFYSKLLTIFSLSCPASFS